MLKPSGDTEYTSWVRGDIRGFTIIELVIATLVFSTVMLVVTGAIVRFTTNYQKSLAQTTTQNATRSIIDSIAESLQFKRDKVRPLASVNGSEGYCVGTTRYSFMPGRMLNQDEPNMHAFVEQRNTGNNCPDDELLNLDQSLPPDTTELLGPNMRVSKFSIDKSSSSELWTVSLRVVYGDDEVLCSPGAPGGGDCDELNSTSEHLTAEDLTCKPQLGADFCAVSELTTTVEPRL